MKQKLFMVLAAMMLLVSTSANAQNAQQKEVKDTTAVAAAKVKAEKQAAPKKAEAETPLKGDVNEDGKVDVADIAAIIAIMKANGGVDEEPALYWYVGTTRPTYPKNAAQNTGVNKWTLLSSTPSQIVVESEMAVGTWYIAIPQDYGFQPYDSVGSTPDPAAYTKSQILIGTVYYDLFTSTGQAISVNAVFKP